MCTGSFASDVSVEVGPLLPTLGLEANIMRVLRRILIATNFSPQAERAFRVGTDLALRYGAEVRLVSALEPPPLYQRLATPVQTHLVPIEELLRKMHGQLEAVAEDARRKGLRVTVDARLGKPFVEIITAARERGSDLIVVGTNATHGAARLLLGSTAERVVRKAALPVLVVKAEMASPPRVVLLPIDFSAGSRRSAEEGLALARRWNARAVLLHVIEPVTQTVVWPADPGTVPIFPIEPAALEEEWTAFVHPLDLSGIDWMQRTMQGHAAESIVAASVETEADLIVIGTHGYGGLMHVLLGSVAERVVRDAACSVMTIRPDAFQFQLP
jgi:nucleotide-binding universal stress UspA family protein